MVDEGRRAPWLSRGLAVGYIAASGLDAAIAGRDADVWQPRRWATKPALMPLLALSSHAQPTLLTVAQAASWGGDVALLRDRDDRWFRVGIACFAAAHLTYTAALLPHARLERAGRQRAAAVAGISTLSALSLGRDARRHRPALAPAVRLYGLVIGTMAATAAAVPADQPGGMALRTGALLFVASDSLIGATTFTAPGAPRRLESVVMATYTAGQLLLALGIRRLHDRPL